MLILSIESAGCGGILALCSLVRSVQDVLLLAGEGPRVNQHVLMQAASVGRSQIFDRQRRSAPAEEEAL